MLNMLKSWLSGSTMLPGSATNLWTPDWLAAAGSVPGRDDDPSPAESMSLSGVYAAATIPAQSLAAITPKIADELPGGGSRRVTDSDSARALADWHMDEREGFLIDSIVNGNGYLKIERNARGGAQALRWIPSWRVMLSVSDDGIIRYEIQADPSIGEGPEAIPERDMVHLRYRLTGRHRLLGVSPLVTAAPALAYCLSIRRVGSRLFKNFSLPVAVLAHPKALSVEASQRLKQSYQNAVTGDNVGQALIINEGMTATQLSAGKAVDLQIEQLSRLSVAEAGRLLGVPLSMLNEPGSVNYSTSVEESRAFVRSTLQPWAIRLSDALGRALISRDERLAGRSVQIDLAPLVRGSGVELADMASKVLNSGALSLNEVRAWFGAPSVTDGDLIRVPTNTVALPDWRTMYAPDDDDDEDPEPESKGSGLIAWLNRHDG